jgi:2-hydroxychromene-2-carboxylate isomerase
MATRDREKAQRLALALFHAYFADGRDISSPQVTVEVAAEMGIAGPDLAAALSDPAVKEAPRSATQQAIARGVFGSPYFIVDGEPFWGNDRLDQLERWLASGAF